MSFNKAGKPELPVFDNPAMGVIQTGFTMRRVVTAAGRSFLAEKNLPIQPATDYRFRKCYSAYDVLLYKLDWHIFSKKEKPPKHRYGEEYIKYEIPKKYFFPYPALRQKLIDPIINAEQPNVISSIKDLEEQTLLLALPNSKQPQYPNRTIIENSVAYPDDNFQFRFMFSDKRQTAEVLEAREYNINNQIGVYFQNNALQAPPKPIFTNEYNYVCLHDFTSFNIEFEEGWRPLRFGQRDLTAVMTPNIEWAKVYPRENCDLKPFKQQIENFEHKGTNETFKYIEGEEFGHFYIKAQNSFSIMERPEYAASQALYSLDLPSLLNDHRPLGFNATDLSLHNIDTYKEMPGSFGVTKHFALVSKEFEIIDGSEKYQQDLAYTRQILGHEKHLKTSKKYRAPHLSLKLSLKKPTFAIKPEKQTIRYVRIISANLCYSYPKHLDIFYAPVRFDHQSPKVFDSRINSCKLQIQTKFKQRRSQFQNKCPNHSKYTRKLLHRILCAAAFKACRKYRYSLNTYSLPKIDKVLTYAFNTNRIIDYKAPKTISYWEKPDIRRLVSPRLGFTDIELSDKFKTIAIPYSGKFVSDNLMKLSKNHLRVLRIIKGRMTKIDRTYHSAYMNALKRVTAIKHPQQIIKGGNSLHALKLNDAIYNNFAYGPSKFTLKYNPTSCDYCDNLPKEVIPGFELHLDICGIPEGIILSQKDIVPPPGWNKQTKEFDCRMRLGPHPFGFPEFFFAPPVFIQLVTQSDYEIRSLTAEKSYREYDFILTKDKLYLPELSMKQPRRLLHSELTAKNSPKEFYIVDIEEPPLQQDQPKHIDSFEQSWLAEKKWKCSTFFGFDMLHTLRTRKVKIKTRKISNDAIDIAEDFLSNIKYKGMPNVTRFLLKNRRFEAKSGHGAIVQPIQMYYGNTDFASTCVNLPDKTYFTSREGFSPLKTEKTWTLPQYFPDTYPSGELPPTYSARFRNFRFPYVPETVVKNSSKEAFAQPDNYFDNCTCHFEEEFRASVFDFTSAEISSAYCTNYDADFVNQYTAQNSFGFETQQIMDSLSRFYIEMPPDKLFLRKSELPKSYQHLISPRFFKARELHSYKYMLRDQSRAAFKFTQMPEHINASYSFYGLKDQSPSELEAANYHWIIMLRHGSHLNGDFGFTFEENTIQTAGIKPVNEFNLTKETPIEENLKAQRFLADPQKSEFKHTTEFNGIEKQIKQNDKLVNEYKKPVIAQLELDALRNSRHLDYLPIADLNFAGNAMAKAEQKMQEPKSNVIYIAKGNASIAAFELKEPKQRFSYREKGYLNMDYKPLYVPDFMDMNEPAKVSAQLITECCQEELAE